MSWPDLWVWVTLGAAAAQTVRFMLQKQLRTATLTTIGATFARFAYSAPLVAALALIYAGLTNQTTSLAIWHFWTFAIMGGLSQIFATLCVVALFTHRHFAVGITFKKTEVLLSALAAVLILGEGLPAVAWFALLIGLPGVLLLSDPPQATGPWHRRILNRAAALGLGSGVFFALSAVGYRGASLSLDQGDAFFRAVVTLACVTAFQTLVMAAWMVWRRPGQITAVARAWRVAGWVGLSSMAGSLCWFTAFTLQTVALVNGVGQIELVFSILIGALVFKEHITGKEIAGVILLLISIVTLVTTT